MFTDRKITLALVLAVLFTLTASAVYAGELSSAQERAFGIHQLTGSWQGSTSLGTTMLLSFHADRTYTVTFNLPGVGAGHGHGAWERTGASSFALTDTSFILDADNALVLLQKTQADVAVHGDAAQFDLLVTLSLPDGTPIDTVPAQAQATRIEVEPAP